MLHKKVLIVFSCFLSYCSYSNPLCHLHITSSLPYLASLFYVLNDTFLHSFPLFFLSSLFAFVVSTGYGNIAPSTEGGKIFCILYAIFGIPLFGFLLAGIGDQLGTIFVKSILRVEKIFRVSYKYTQCIVISCYMCVLYCK